jgi:hypothetical protein
MSKKETPVVKTDKTNEEVQAAKPVPVPATRPPKKTEMQLRVEYTRDEIVDLARKLAESHGELTRGEEDKKAVTAQLKAKCESIAARTSELSSKIASGFEYRMTPCEIRYDDPKPGLKSTVRLDTLEIVNVDPMTLTERQGELALGATTSTGAPTPAKVLTFEDFDLTTEQLHVAGTTEENAETFADWLRDMFIEMGSDEPMSADRRREFSIALIREESPDDVTAFLCWLKAPRDLALPGADIAAEAIEYVLREARDITATKAKAKGTKARKVTPGTVECAADEGSRDDAGPEAKDY